MSSGTLPHRGGLHLSQQPRLTSHLLASGSHGPCGPGAGRAPPPAVVSRPWFDACVCQKANILCAGLPQPPESPPLAGQPAEWRRRGAVVGREALRVCHPHTASPGGAGSGTDLCVWGFSWAWAEGFGSKDLASGACALSWPPLQGPLGFAIDGSEVPGAGGAEDVLSSRHLFPRASQVPRWGAHRVLQRAQARATRAVLRELRHPHLPGLPAQRPQGPPVSPEGVGALPVLCSAPRLTSVCPQVPVPGGRSEEPAQAPGLAGEAPRGQARHPAEEHQGGSQLVSECQGRGGVPLSCCRLPDQT